MDFMPAVYEHAARFVSRTPWEVSREPELLFQAHAGAWEFYHHQPVVVGIDVYNPEPEALGARIDRPDENAIPAINSHPYTTLQEVLDLPLLNPKADGRIPMIIQTAKRLKVKLPGADVRVPVSGPFSIASNLVGFETLLMEIILQPELVQKVLAHLVQGQLNYCREAIQNGLDVTFFESAATPPLISPQLFREVELPALNEMIGRVAELAGHPVACIIGGNTAPIIRDILQTGTGYVICPSETDQADFMQKIAAYPEVMVRINMNPATLTTHDDQIAFNEADRVLALAGNRKKVCLGTGVLPFEANPELVLKVGAYIRSQK
jgi:uroporphyrinogen decarboxylase